MRNRKDKFSFNPEFQEYILQYTCSDRKGYSIIDLYQDTYFTLLTHQFIAFSLKRYFKAKKRIPSMVYFLEYIRQQYNRKEFREYVTQDFRDEVDSAIKRIYSSPPPDSDDIRDEVIKFARYTELKETLDNIDVNDYNNYSALHGKIQKAITVGSNKYEDSGIRVVGGIADRNMDRGSEKVGFKSPYWQLNRSQNGGSIAPHSLIMLMSQAKRFKTGTLINFARACLGHRKRGLYIDLENGAMKLATRMDQGVVNADRDSVEKGEHDKRLLKQYRKYKRIGAELIIKRMPAHTTCMDDVQKLVDKYKLEEGLVFNFAIIDYGDLLASNDGEKDETKRISNSFLDMKNFAEFNDLDFIATASHVNRAASKRRDTKYLPEDVAKCIDKIRHLDICIGLQENEAEREEGVMRWEIIDQRDGPQDATMYFWVDIAKQTLKEFTRAEVKKLSEMVGEVEKRREDSKDV